LGLRIEYVKLDYFVNPNHPVYQSDGYHYFQPFPSFRFSYKVNEDNRISFFYNRRIDRPNEVDIRIFPKYDDAEIIKVGNPALKPQYTNSFEVGFKKNLTQSYFYAALFFKLINGTITRIATTETGSNLIYNVFQNTGKSYQTGIEATYSNKVSDWYSFNLNSTFYHNQINSFEVINLYPTPTLFYAKTQSLFTGNIKWNNQFQFSKTFSGQVSTWYLAPELIPQGKIKSRYSIDFGIKKKIQKEKGELFFNATDLFNTLVIRSQINGTTVSFNSSNYVESQIFRLGYSYNF
jgi:outer membrane receptor protein involved in Fe transport